MNLNINNLREALLASSERVKSCAKSGQISTQQLHTISDWEACLALAIKPMPIDSIQHLLQAHKQAHPHLHQLFKLDYNREIAIGTDGYTYTPRKVLRRVLDHALDHLNQIEQWIMWQQNKVKSNPTDGWAGSGITFKEDKTPLDERELQSWLWRIDLVINMIIERTKHLMPEQLSWQSPNDGWTINKILHHLAAAEIFYVAWLDNPLPEDLALRYTEANSRLLNQLMPILENGIEKDMAFWGNEIDMWTPEQVATSVLEQEKNFMKMNEKKRA